MKLPITFYVYGDPTIHRVATYYDENLVQVTSKFGTSFFSKPSVERHFEDGSWVEISFAEAGGNSYKIHDGPVEEICEVRVDGVVQERPLVFPFTFYNQPYPGVIYTVLEKAGNCVVMYDNADPERTFEVLESTLRGYIADGSWIVTSVGPQKPVEAATEPPKDTDTLTFNLDSEALEQAVKRLNRLAEAVENVNIAMESFQAIFEDTQELLAGGVQGQCVTFCCDGA